MTSITHPELARIDGQSINIATLDDAVRAAIDAAQDKRGFRFFTLNLDHLVKRRDDAGFRAVYEKAEFVSADGAPVAMLARRQCDGITRTTGADLVEPLCQEAAKAAIPVAFFGSDLQTLERAAGILRARYPGLNIAHIEAPPYGFDPNSHAATEAAQRIEASGANLVFVALGAPKQEYFAAAMAHVTPGLGFICIGAALDFIAGSQVRAPIFLQKTGLEWVWRLATNPSRMARRYALCAGVFATLLMRGSTQPRKPQPI